MLVGDLEKLSREFTKEFELRKMVSGDGGDKWVIAGLFRSVGEERHDKMAFWNRALGWRMGISCVTGNWWLHADSSVLNMCLDQYGEWRGSSGDEREVLMDASCAHHWSIRCYSLHKLQFFLSVNAILVVILLALVFLSMACSFYRRRISGFEWQDELINSVIYQDSVSISLRNYHSRLRSRTGDIFSDPNQSIAACLDMVIPRGCKCAYAALLWISSANYN